MSSYRRAEAQGAFIEQLKGQESLQTSWGVLIDGLSFMGNAFRRVEAPVGELKDQGV